MKALRPQSSRPVSVLHKHEACGSPLCALRPASVFLNRLPTQHVLHIRDLRLTQRSTSVINTLPRPFIHLRKHFILISERPLQLQIHASCLSFKSFFVLDLHFPVCVTTKTEALYSHKCLQLINKSSLYGSFCGGTLVSQSADAGCVQQRNQTQTKH